jgi:hypothetical protein
MMKTIGEGLLLRSESELLNCECFGGSSSFYSEVRIGGDILVCHGYEDEKDHWWFKKTKKIILIKELIFACKFI